MSTGYRGDVLFFTTELSQTGAGQPAWGKAFVATTSGIEEFLVLDRIASRWPYYNVGEIVTAEMTNAYSIDGIHLASRGSALSIQALKECNGAVSSSLCGYNDYSTIYNDRGEIILTAPGRVRLSPNGKWALGLAVGQNSGFPEVSIYDLAGNRRFRTVTSASVMRTWWKNGIADDGTAVLAGSGLRLYRPGEYDFQLLREAWADSGTIDGEGRRIAWSEVDSASGRSSVSLLLLGEEGTASPTAVTPDGFSDRDPQLSDDGTRLLVLSVQGAGGLPQLHLLETSPMTRRQVTSEQEGISTAVLSGDGRVVWALTRRGRLMRIDTDSLAVTQLTKPLPGLFLPVYSARTDRWHPWVIQGTPGQPFALPAAVMPGESLEISIDGRAAPVFSIEPQLVRFQLPWTLPTGGELSLTLRKPGTPDWFGSHRALLYEVWPSFESVAHQDFRGPVTRESPARPGEILHLFGAGFGPVDPPVGMGPTPLSPLSRVVLPYECQGYLSSPQTGGVTLPLTILFAGLAPTLTGVYQFDMRLPESLPLPPPTQVSVRCSSPGYKAATFNIAVAP